MRVIAGKARGRTLVSPRGSRVRPTADRVKEALFNIIGPRILGARVLDLFAGSGSIGIESLSRGASQVVFVDNHGDSIAVLKKNLAVTGFASQAQVRKQGVDQAIDFLARTEQYFDFVFLDPPYGEGRANEVLNSLDQANIVKEQGLLVVEHSRLESLEGLVFRNIRCVQVRKYGDTLLSFFTPEGPGHDNSQEG